MPYPEFFVAPMREELTSLGVEELRTPGDVDAAVQASTGTVMIVVNSVCGCAAGKARPGLALALRSGVKPDRVASVFAGFDNDATDARPQLLHRLRAFVAVDCAVPRRQARVHARAQPDRESRRARHRERAQGRVRAILQPGLRKNCLARRGVRGDRQHVRVGQLGDDRLHQIGPDAFAGALLHVVQLARPCSSAIGPRCRAPVRGPSGRRRGTRRTASSCRRRPSSRALRLS